MAWNLLILAVAMAGIGVWVARQIESGVVQRTAATTALDVDSLVAPAIQQIAAPDPAQSADTGAISASDAARLDRLFRHTPLGQEVAVFRVWDRDGRVVYSTVPELVEQRLARDAHLDESFAGLVVAEIGEVEAAPVLPPGVPRGDLLEIYSPVRSRGTNEVVAVAEFYCATDDLRREIGIAQRRSWLVVGGATLAIYLLLSVFVRRASRTIECQRRTLADQVARLTVLLRQNDDLH